MAISKEEFHKLFEIEIDGWCYGMTQYPGELFPELVHGIVRELKPLLVNSIKYSHVYDITKIAQKFAKSCKYIVPEKELVFNILAQLPAPTSLKTEDEMYTIAQILDKVEQSYNGAIERMERRWRSGGEEAKL